MHYTYTLQTARNIGNGNNTIEVSASTSLQRNSYLMPPSYRRTIQIFRFNTTQTTNPLLQGVCSIINAGLVNGNGVFTLKFDNSKWPLVIYKNKGFWINGIKKSKGSINMIVSYMISRHIQSLTYEEAENLFINIENTDLVIAETILNKLKYSFYDDDGEEVETMLNVEKTGDKEVSIELNEGLWVSFKDTTFKSFMRACNKNKNKYYSISPEELYYECSGKVLSVSNTKLMHAFLTQNRHSDLVEKKSMELIEGLASRFPTKIKNINVYGKHRRINEDGEPLSNLYKGMLIKGAVLDWLVFTERHAAHMGGTQNVSTYCIVSNKNFTLREANEDEGDEAQIISIDGANVPVRGWPTDFKPEGHSFFGPICIDQTQTDVSLGDQYAARALALLNDSKTFTMVSTLNSYRNYNVVHRVDFDAVSELSIK